jgi:hypothetical protein
VTPHPQAASAITHQIADDPQQPRPDRPISVEPAEGAEEPEHRLLGQIERVVRMAGELQRKQVGGSLVGPGQPFAGVDVSALGRPDRQRLVRRRGPR